jgi:transcriptional regulator with XRE-family HTH domain
MSAQNGPYVEQAQGLEAFLHDMRALRERQGLSIADLAQRTHFPVETIKAAEAGPARPTLPVVEAYVRACGEEPDAWEDRWRVLPAQFLPAQFTITRLGRDGRRRLLPKLALAAGIAVVAAGGGTLLVLRPAGHEAARAVPRHVTVQAPASASAPVMAGTTATAMPQASHSATPAAQPRQAPSAAPAQAQRGATGPMVTGPVVTGVGCPQGQGVGVTVNNAATGPGWAAAAAGWTGDGCDGGSVWTMNPNGKQPASSTLTWFFTPSATATSCTVAVFVPTQNALGVADYAVSTGTANTATVTVDQSSAAGQWVTLGSYPVNGSPLNVQISPDLTTLTAAGPGPGRGHNSAIAASAARAACG